MKTLLFSTALLAMIASCGTPSSQTAEQGSTDTNHSALEAVMQAEELLLKEPRSKDEVQDELDTDDDGDISKDEMKAGLDNLGQKIKAAIEAKHAEVKAAMDAAKDSIQDACAGNRGSEACRATAQEERAKVKEIRQKALEDLQKELDALKSMLTTVESETVTLS